MELREFKNDVKAVIEYLAQSGIEVQHTVMMEAISRGFGERTWAAHREALNSLKARGQVKKPEVAAALAEPAPWQPGNGPMSESQYLARKGLCCPACGSRDIESKAVDADGPHGAARASCNTCNALWTDNWVLAGYDNLEVLPNIPAAPVIPTPSGVEDREQVSGQFVSVWDGGYEVWSSAVLFIDTGEVAEIGLAPQDVEMLNHLDGDYFVVEGDPDLVRYQVENRDNRYFVGPEGMVCIRKLLKMDKVVDESAALTLAEIYTAIRGELVEVSVNGVEYRTPVRCMVGTGGLRKVHQVPPRGNVPEVEMVTRLFETATPQAALQFEVEQTPVSKENAFSLTAYSLRSLRTVMANRNNELATELDISAILEKLTSLGAAEENLGLAEKSEDAQWLATARAGYCEKEKREHAKLIELAGKSARTF